MDTESSVMKDWEGWGWVEGINGGKKDICNTFNEKDELKKKRKRGSILECVSVEVRLRRTGVWE